jgi:phosphonate transport system permease protein
LVSDRTRRQTARLLDDLWPPALPPGGRAELVAAVLDTVAMAVLAMAVAVLITLLLGPWATRAPRGPAAANAGGGRRALRLAGWVTARAALLVLRSVPPTIWAVIALLVLFPGILPGAVALGLYTGGILGRLVAEAWESIDLRPRDALRVAGVPGWLAALAAVTPPSARHLVTYTLYRFEICIRDTAVVGVVGAAGLGRLLDENLAVFRMPVVTTLLAASFAVSLGSEVLGRRLHRSLGP